MKTTDWQHYFETAYEETRRRNTILAGKVQDAEKKREFLSAKVSKISGNPVFRAAQPAGKAARRLKRKSEEQKLYRDRTRVPSEVLPANDPLYLRYRDQVEHAQNPYGEWIRLTEAQMDRPWKGAGAVDRWKIFSTRELGELDQKAFEEAVQTEGLLGILFADQPEALDAEWIDAAQYELTMHADAQIWYADEDHIRKTENGQVREEPWYKPAASVDAMLQSFRFGSFVAIRAEVLRNLKLYDSDKTKETAADANQMDALTRGRMRLYDLCLQLMFTRTGVLASDRIRHTDAVFYHNPEEISEAAQSDFRERTELWGYTEAYLPVRKAALERLGLKAAVYENFLTGVVSVAPVQEAGQEQKISVIIPSKDHPELLEQCLGTLLERTDYPVEKLEILVVDNGSSRENRERIEALLGSIKTNSAQENGQGPTLRYLYQEQEFNFSAMCNLGAEKAEGELLLFLNDDVEVIEGDWLRIMAGQAMIPGTGAVGAKLWYAAAGAGDPALCETIQHAGITNLAIGPGHKLVRRPDDRMYYYGHGTLPMNMSAVTGACLLISREHFREAGGFWEELKIGYNDVDLCFTLLEKQLRNVQRNDAVLVHHESVSRGSDENGAQHQRLLSEKKKLYERHPRMERRDPYYSRWLRQDSDAYEIGYLFPCEDRRMTITPTEISPEEQLPAEEAAAVKLTVDVCGCEEKWYADEPDTLAVTGWSYMDHADNCRFDRQIILRSEKHSYLAPVQGWFRQDVNAVIPGQVHARLSGFTCRLRQNEIAPGYYRCGILYTDLKTGRKYCRYAENPAGFELR